MKWYIVGLLLLLSPSFSWGSELTFRLGEGGMHEERAPDNSLGGHQISAHVLFDDLPLGFSISQETYTKGPDPTEIYEIENLLIASAFYVQPLATRFTRNLLLGVGVGRLKIPQGESATAFQASVLIDTQVAWRISGYAEAKYLHSSHDSVDFRDFGFVVGIGFRAASW